MFSKRLDHNYEKVVEVEKGDIVLDAGAAQGLFSMSVIDKAGYIIVVEPNPDYFSFLQSTFKNINKVALINQGLWNRAEKRKIKLSGWSSNILSAKESEIETNTIDNITTELGLSRIDFIKMDIEGAEIEALEGADYTLSNTRKLVISAYHRRPDLKLNETFHIIEDMLICKGFNTVITKDKLVHAWK